VGLATSICFGSHIGATDILTLLIKASATVTVYGGHRDNVIPGKQTREQAIGVLSETLHNTYWVGQKK